MSFSMRLARRRGLGLHFRGLAAVDERVRHRARQTELLVRGAKQDGARVAAAVGLIEAGD
ncbi:MAG: hypothetical protein K0A98_01860 [Trueperaceae bacterium]|nr:hypothetical protein [Trueperaceae bacterium]